MQHTPEAINCPELRPSLIAPIYPLEKMGVCNCLYKREISYLHNYIFAQNMIMLFPKIRNRWLEGERKTENSLLRMIANANVWQKTNIMIWARINEQ